ncbi:MAG TPA: beta-ketoacyl-ACP synthase III [Accumulibacter sp.]|uniref:beta-ketoacyl-ACP synthase III n=2 Tax=Accumulibacter sp. TaxID=2053492 RepID=UPI00287A0B5A|nr:beta-ketoacyl-ACP synthase III [Accumulibacter sp.]MDS4055073.1 beta-ketoacyl-ACP synthase III [Accumulibacter sp.]HMV05311.1 beta-ketoacyl-ACP synthase III [Accumulibacter sp.]HMW64627.1 beta-ketoacyl-ACP synthase III [Accumulibacter sp.]HMW80266.1 beta-ketoacyl-ACP synthase III [Accumulibacter sp.]HMX69537.1 beta-ketoacyl-ACP synthase III [Accumulibacter sp.]
MQRAALTATGVYTAPYVISNEELVAAYNEYARNFNADNAARIVAGELAACPDSSVDFIEKASGITRRYVMDKAGVLDPQRMRPRFAARRNEELSLQAEMAVAAGGEALAAAGRTGAEVDAVICAASNMQRAYPAMAVEIQQALGVERGYAFDMNVACSSATFALDIAVNAVRCGTARTVLVVNPEICSAHLAWKDRDCHFIFGDVCTAIVVERLDAARSAHAWEVLGSKLATSFSNNIRNNAGFLSRCEDRDPDDRDQLFVQEGRRVFKEVCPMAAEHMTQHLASLGFTPLQVRRFWLHQANLAMNQLIGRRLLGREATADEAPVILDEFANTASAGSIIAFHRHNTDLASGDLGLLCSFGAGYSIGSLALRKC